MKYQLKLWFLALGVAVFLLIPKNTIFAQSTDFDPREYVSQVKEAREKEVQRKADSKEIDSLKNELRRKIKYINGTPSAKLTSIFHHPIFAATHWNTSEGLSNAIANASTSTSDIDAMNEALDYAEAGLNEVSGLSKKLKLKIETYNDNYPSQRIDSNVNGMFTSLGNRWIVEEDVIKLPVTVNGVVRYISFKVDGSDVLVPAADSHRHTADAAPASSSDRRPGGWNFGEDDTKDKDNVRSECPDGNCGPEHSKTETFFANLLPWVGIVGTGFAAVSNYRLKRDEIKMGERLMNQASQRGESPYMYMGIMQGAMNYDPFAFMGESLAPSMMAISQLYNGNSRGGNASRDEFAKYYENKERTQRMLMLLQAQRSRQTNVSSSKSTTERIQMQQTIKGLQSLADSMSPGQLTDEMRQRMQAMRQELSGGVSSRERQDLYKAVSTLAQNIQSQEQYFNNMGRVLDQVDMLWGQAGQMTQNQNGQINGNGGITTTIDRTINDNFNSNSSGNRVGNGGFPQMPGSPIYGGGQGGGVRYVGPNGNQFGLQINNGGR